MVGVMKNRKTFIAALFALCVAFPALTMAGVVNVSKPRPSVVGLQAPDAQFANAIEDLPLMAGMEVVPENDVVFIFGRNRLVQTTARGRVDIDSVYYFYQESLPQLGWKEISPRLYERGNEQLHVDASSANADGMTYVRFEVKPVAPVK